MAREFKAFKFWCQKVLPLVYDESLSYYEVLCKVVDYLNKMAEGLTALGAEVEVDEANIAELQKDVAFLKSEMEKVKNGKYVSLYLDSIKNWIDDNIKQLVANIVKYVFFGLTEDGYFAAYIPEVWSFIRFSTDVVPDSEWYGHLLLYY